MRSLQKEIGETCQRTVGQSRLADDIDTIAKRLLRQHLHGGWVNATRCRDVHDHSIFTDQVLEVLPLMGDALLSQQLGRVVVLGASLSKRSIPQGEEVQEEQMLAFKECL